MERIIENTERNNSVPKGTFSKKPLLSIIVPVYNTEPYLAECLNTLCNQTLRDLEIVCVNDGSTDGSLEILREYERKDERVRVFDQENQGVSAARNRGIKNARGKYLFFMDSDDILDVHLAEYGVGLAEENQCEVVNIRTLANCRQEVNIPYVRKLENQICFQKTRVYQNITEQQREYFHYVSGGLYHNIVLSETLKKYDILFPVGIAINEDYFVCFLLYSQMKNIGFLFATRNLFIKRWRSDSASITSSKKRTGQRCKNWDQFRVFDVLQRRFIEREQFNSHRALVVRYLTYLRTLYFNLPRDERRFFKGEVDKIWNDRIADIVADPMVLPLFTRYFWIGLYSRNRIERLTGQFITLSFCTKRFIKETIKLSVTFVLNLLPSKYVSRLPVKLQRWHKNAPASLNKYK